MTKYGRLKALGKCTKCWNENDTPEFATCSICREKNREWEKQNRVWYSEHGICVRCHKENASPGKKMCLECCAYFANKNENKTYNHELHSKTDKKRYEYRKANGLCTKCGKPRGRCKSTVMCNECYQKHRRNKSKSYWSKVEIPRKKRPEYGLCFICGEPYEPNGFKVCDKCREIQRQAALEEDKTKWLEWQIRENRRVRTRA